MSNSPDRDKVLQQIRERIERSVRNPRPSLSSEEVAAHLDALFSGKVSAREGDHIERLLEEVGSRYAELKGEPEMGISLADSRARFERRWATDMTNAKEQNE